MECERKSDIRLELKELGSNEVGACNSVLA